MDPVENWLQRLRPTTARVSKCIWGQFIRWLQVNGGPFKEYSPSQLLEYQRAATSEHRYDLLDLTQRFILSQHGRKGTKMNKYIKVRSFFLHNRADLPGDRSFKIRGDESKVQGSLTVEQVRELILACNPMYHALILVMFQSGMGENEIIYWSRFGFKKLLKDLETNPSIVRVDLPGRKGNERPFYTFISGDALEAVKVCVNRIGRAADCIFPTSLGTSISYPALHSYWRDHLNRLGLWGVGDSKSYRSGKNSHEMRDLFRSQWAKSPAKPEVGEFFMGHNIDPLAYNKAWQDEKFYREEYLKALPYLQLLSSGRPYHQIDEGEVESLRKEVDQLRASRAEWAGQKEETEALKKRLEEMEVKVRNWQQISEDLEKVRQFIQMRKS